MQPNTPQRRLKTATTINQILLQQLLAPGMITIDATLGKGNDAKTLLELTAPDGRLYGFDIQPEALRITTEKLSAISKERYQLFDTGHQTIAEYVAEPCDLAIFNLGYLPSGDKAITTLLESTVLGVAQAFNALKVGGLLMVTVYPGHEEGHREAQALATWFGAQPQQIADVLHYEFVNHKNAPPHTYLLEKRSTEPLTAFDFDWRPQA